MDKATLERLYNQERLSLSQIAQRFDVTPQAVWARMRKYGIPRRPAKTEPKYNFDRAMLEELYWKKRLSSEQMARLLGLKHSKTVRKILARHGIRRRTLSEAMTKYQKTPFGGEPHIRSYMLGLRAGDVYAQRTHKVIRVQTTTTHPAQVEMMRRTFGPFSHVGTYKFFNRNAVSRPTHEWYVYCDLHPSFDWLLTKPAEMPEEAMKNDELFWHFLAGYADSEASWKILKNHENNVRFVLRIMSQDKAILKQMHQKLRALGYGSLLYFDTKAGPRPRGPRSNADTYALMVYHRSCLLRMCRKLLPLSRHPEKIRQMQFILDHKDSRRWSDVKDIILALRADIKNSRLV
jgi:hypothetical protein